MAIRNTNPRIGTINNLEQGGTHDLLMITYPDGFPEGGILFNIEDTPRKISGIQKVAQTFLKLLLTTKGSNVVYPNQGTAFSELAINANRTKEEAIIHSELASAVKDAETQTKMCLNSIGTDTSSMLSQIELLGLDVSEESILMYLRVETMDGMSAAIAVPFPEFDLN